MTPEFWRDRRVFLTGHTGFKGAWLALWLEHLGSRVSGYSLAAPTAPALFEILAPWPRLVSTIADVRDRTALRSAISEWQPEIVIHLAAQALVRAAYEDPIETFGTNVLGTANLLDVIRNEASVRSVLVVTSDKVYDQAHASGDFVESDRLGGSDPYSASKSAQEIVAASFYGSYLEGRGVRLATARAGNVIGGGDWAADRLIPDYFRTVAAGRTFELRYPEATRPWQHVLDPLNGYLSYVERLSTGVELPASLNFGPDESSVTVAEVVAKLAAATGSPDGWDRRPGELWPEHSELGLDSSKARETLGWRPTLSVEAAIAWTAEWYQRYQAGSDMRAFSIGQIAQFTEGAA